MALLEELGDFDAALRRFIGGAQEKLDAYHSQHGMGQERLETEDLKRYIRIIARRDDGGRSA